MIRIRLSISGVLGGGASLDVNFAITGSFRCVGVNAERCTSPVVLLILSRVYYPTLVLLLHEDRASSSRKDEWYGTHASLLQVDPYRGRYLRYSSS